MPENNDEHQNREHRDPSPADSREHPSGLSSDDQEKHRGDDDAAAPGIPDQSATPSATSPIPWAITTNPASPRTQHDDTLSVSVDRLKRYGSPDLPPQSEATSRATPGKPDPRSRRLLRWARTLPGFLILCGTLVSAAASVYFGAFYHQPGHLRASLDFAFLSPGFIDTKNSGLQLTIYNGTSSTQVVTDVRVAGETYTPLPYAIENRSGTSFRIENRPVSVAIPPGGEEVVIFRTSTVAALQPYKLDIDLASGTEVAVNVDPFIDLLRCAVSGTPADSCFVGGELIRNGQTLQPYLATQAGLVGLTVGPEPKVPKACRHKRVMSGTDPCVASLLRQAVFFPIGLHEHETWSGPFPPPPTK